MRVSGPEMPNALGQMHFDFNARSFATFTPHLLFIDSSRTRPHSLNKLIRLSVSNVHTALNAQVTRIEREIGSSTF